MSESRYPGRFLGLITAAGDRHPLGGRTSDCDVGKAVFEQNGVVVIENNEQLARRMESGTSNAELASRALLEDFGQKIVALGQEFVLLRQQLNDIISGGWERQ